MAESLSVVSSLFPVDANSRKPKSLYPYKSSSISQNHSCLNRPLGSELICTFARKSSTSQPKHGQSIKENEDYVGHTEVSSCECSDKNGIYRDSDLNLGLDLTLWINHVERKHADSQQNTPIPRVQSNILGGMEQESILPLRDFRAPAPIREDNNNNMYSVSRNKIDADKGFEGSHQEVIVGQPGLVQCSASGRLKEKREETPVSNSKEAKHLAIFRNTSEQFQSFAETNHSEMDDLCNLSHDKAFQLSRFAHNLTDYHFAAPCDTSITQRNTLGSLTKPRGENRQEDAMAGSFGQHQGNSLYVKVNMDGVAIGRKVDMHAYESYESLAHGLENMFQRTTENHLKACIALGNQRAVKALRLLDPAADFVLTYEDSEGDWMLATDVPWKMFLHTVKRLRIMKNSGNNGVAQKCSKKRKTT